MNTKIEVLSKHDEYIMIARNEIKRKELSQAKENLIKAIEEDIELPDSYNLLGVIWELLHDKQRAAKFYRVAYNFDPTFEPASKNLDRVTSFFRYSFSDIDFGEI